jgi:hypothetical protein
MKRRETLKYLGLSIGSVITLPAWANGWRSSDLSTNAPKVLVANESLLAEMVETIIPTTDTAGAKTLGIDKFIQKIVADCFDKPTKEIFGQGFGLLEEQTKKAYNKSFVDCSPQQRTEILQQIEKDKNNVAAKFYGLVKGVTVQGYLSSEYVMVNHYDYKMIPNKFEPCASVNG